MKIKENSNTHIAIVLDKSGSMGKVRYETISGFNEQVQTIKGDATDNTYVSFITFNDEVDEIFSDKPVAILEEIDRDSYEPHGTTALLDAVGYIIGKLKISSDNNEDDRFLIIIMSDGLENASKEYTQKQVANMIKGLEDKGNWTFTYMGDIDDIESLADNLNIKKGNVQKYKSDSKGTMKGFKSMKSSTSSYLKREEMQTSGFYDDVDD